MLRIGFGNAVVASRVRHILSLKTPAGRRWQQEADEIGKLIDATAGRHTRTVLITDSGHIILSSLTSEMLKERWKVLTEEDKEDSGSFIDKDEGVQ
jgi:extracellular matrix regulatory protein A